MLAGSAARAAPGTAFGDLAGFGWAAPGIVALQGEGVLNGASPSTFDPSGLLTRAEMAAVLGRLLGWQPQGAGPSFTDAAAIPAYARPYVAEAAAKGILQGLPGGAFGPQGDLTWPQLAAVAARALAYPPTAASQVAGILSQLPQGASTPAWAQQAVAQDIQAGDFTGALADLYRPARDVTRAELAAFVAQAQQVAGGSVGGGAAISGQLTAFAAQQATVQTPAGAQRVAISPAAAIYDGTAPGGPADLQPGSRVTLGVTNGTAAAVDITSSPSLTRPAGLTDGLRGSLVWATGTQVGVAPPGMATVYVPLASDVAVTLAGGQSGTLGEVGSGAAIALTLNTAGQALAITAAGGSTTSMTGTVVSLAGGALSLDVAGTDETFSLPPALAASGGVAPGAEVTLTLSLPGGQVAGLTVDSPASPTSLTGTVASVLGDALVLDVSGTDQTYTLSGATSVNGVAGDLGAIAAGQTASLTLSGGLVTAVQTSIATTTVTGIVASIAGDALVLDVSGTDQTYTLSGATTVNGVAGDLGAIAAGQTASLTLSGGLVTAVQTSIATTTVTGTVASIAGDALELDVSGTDQTYTLSGATTVNGVAGDLGAIAAGQTANLTLSGGLVTAVQESAYGTVTGVIASVLGDALVLEVSGANQTYTLSGATMVNGVAGGLSALAAGQAATLTVSGGQVTAITTGTATTVTGQVVSVSGDSVVVDVAGVDETYTLTSSAAVDGVLTAGDTVTLSLAGSEITAAQVGGTASATSATGVVESLAGNNLILDVGGTAEIFTVTPATAVDGVSGDLAALAAGSTVTLTLSDGTVTGVQVQPTTGTTLTGQVLSLAGDTLDLDVSGAGEVFTVTPTTTVDGRLGNLGAVFIGETVTVTASGTAVSSIETSAAGSVTGAVVSVSPATLVVNVAGTYESFTLTASTTVDGALGDTAALAAGQTVTVYAAGGAATAVQITSTSGGSGATGLLESVAGDSLVVDVAGVSQAYTLGASTTIDGSANDLGALAAGQTVSLTAVGGQVTAVEILSGTGSASVSGVVASVAGDVVVVEVLGADRTFTLTPASTVDGVANNAAAIAAGDTVTLTLSGGQVTAVQIG